MQAAARITSKSQVSLKPTAATAARTILSASFQHRQSSSKPACPPEDSRDSEGASHHVPRTHSDVVRRSGRRTTRVRRSRETSTTGSATSTTDVGLEARHHARPHFIPFVPPTTHLTPQGIPWSRKLALKMILCEETKISIQTSPLHPSSPFTARSLSPLHFL